MQCNLHVVLVRDAQRRVQGAGVGTGVLVDLEAADAPSDQCLFQWSGGRGTPAPQPADVDRPGIQGPNSGPQSVGIVDAHPPQRPVFLAQDGRHPRAQLGVQDPRGQQVDVGVDAPRRRDQAFTVDHCGAGTHDDVDPVEGVGVARATDGDDPAAADPDRGLPDAHHGIHEHDIGDHQIAGGRRRLRDQVHAVASRLAEADQELIAPQRVIRGDLDDQPGVAQPDPVAHARAVGRCIILSPHGRLLRNRRRDSPVRRRGAGPWPGSPGRPMARRPDPRSPPPPGRPRWA